MSSLGAKTAVYTNGIRKYGGSGQKPERQWTEESLPCTLSCLDSIYRAWWLAQLEQPRKHLADECQ